MDGRAKYEAEVVSIFRGFSRPMPQPAPRMDQQDLSREEEAAKIFFSSLDHFLGDLERAAAMTELRQSQLHELRDALLDYAPGKATWFHAIDEAKRGK